MTFSMLKIINKEYDTIFISNPFCLVMWPGHNDFALVFNSLYRYTFFVEPEDCPTEKLLAFKTALDDANVDIIVNGETTIEKIY